MNDIIFPITIKKGVSFTLPIAWRDENKVLYVVAGYTASLRFRETLTSSEVLAEFTDSDAVTLTDEDPDLNIQIDLDDAQTSEFPVVECGVWELDITKDGLTIEILSGTFESVLNPARPADGA